MTLLFKVGTMSMQRLHVLRKRKEPTKGETIDVINREIHGSKAFRVHVTEIREIGGRDKLFVVELM